MCANWREIFTVQNIVQYNGGITLLYNRYRQKSAFLLSHYLHCLLELKTCQFLETTLRESELEDNEAKCYLIPYLNTNKVAFPRVIVYGEKMVCMHVQGVP